MIDLDDQLAEARLALTKVDHRADIDAELAAVHARSRHDRRRMGFGAGAAVIVALLLVATVAVTRRPGTEKYDVSTSPATTEVIAPTTVAASTPTSEAPAPDVVPPVVPTTAGPTTVVTPPSTTPPTTSATTSTPPTTALGPTSTIARRSPPTSSHPDPLPGVPAGIEAYDAWKANVPPRYTYRYMIHSAQSDMWWGSTDVTVATVDGVEQVVAVVDADTGEPVSNPSAASTIGVLYEDVFVKGVPNSTMTVATGQAVAGVPSVVDYRSASVQFRLEISGFWLD